MIIGVEVDFKEIISQGKKYRWPRPESCRKCGNGLWGHGYVWRYFEQAKQGCWIKRYYCPGCGLVITLRPKGYWPRFYHQHKIMRWILGYHEKHGCWPNGISRQIAGHWKRSLKRQVEKILGLLTEVFPSGFDRLIKQGLVPVSRSKNAVTIPQLC